MQRDRKVKANNANARASTGPKTPRGRARSARNAFRHELSLPVEADLVLSERMQALTRQIARPDTTVQIQILAHRIAEAQVDLLRVRYARLRLLLEEPSKALRSAGYGSDQVALSDSRLKVAILFAHGHYYAGHIPAGDVQSAREKAN
jgi:hypothetical protein